MKTNNIDRDSFCSKTKVKNIRHVINNINKTYERKSFDPFTTKKDIKSIVVRQNQII